jgi:hypothetical protein
MERQRTRWHLHHIFSREAVKKKYIYYSTLTGAKPILSTPMDGRMAFIGSEEFKPVHGVNVPNQRRRIRTGDGMEMSSIYVA